MPHISCDRSSTTTVIPTGVITLDDIKKWDDLEIHLTPYNRNMELRRSYWWKTGVYAFVSNDTLLYVGASHELTNRVSAHLKRKQAREMGYNNIHAYVIECANRFDLEKDIISRLQPVMNKNCKKLKTA